MPGRLSYDLEVLDEWYNPQREINSTIPPIEQEDFRIVIAFQDTESFPSNIISDFLLRFQNFLRRLPVVLLFGVASTLDEFEQMLPLSAIKLLDSKVFQVRENDECLKLIVEEVCRFVNG
jgi:origin recognition complex subunit 3